MYFCGLNLKQAPILAEFCAQLLVTFRVQKTQGFVEVCTQGLVQVQALILGSSQGQGVSSLAPFTQY